MRIWRRLQDRPRWLEAGYLAADAAIGWSAPLLARVERRRVDRWLGRAERLVKERLFDCRMCGQCVLHSTGMTCPMTCPKNLRNGPCGGVWPNGACEVDRERRCIWVDAVERASHMRGGARELSTLQRPLDHRLSSRSAWLGQLESDGRLRRGASLSERS